MWNQEVRDFTDQSDDGQLLPILFKLLVSVGQKPGSGSQSKKKKRKRTGGGSSRSLTCMKACTHQRCLVATEAGDSFRGAGV